jgi:diketogulonate reductase-like aldo/keto reductase
MVDSIDLYLIHQPYGDVYGSWRAMQELNKEGKIRAIGVSNFPSERLMDLILHNEISPAVNQVEIHPFFQQAAAKQIMSEYNVVPEAWGPFAEGKNDFFHNEILSAIGRQYGKSISQVALRWQIQCGVVTIPKSVHRERIEENFNIWDFELSAEDMAKIATLDGKESLFGLSDPVAMVKRLSGFQIHT